MQPNRANEPVSAPAGSRPATPARSRRARRGINPWFILLITLIPILALSCMFFGIGWYALDWNQNLFGQDVFAESEPTPQSDLVPKIALEYDQNAKAYSLDEQGYLLITGKATNNTGVPVHSVQLKAEVYSGGEKGEAVGSGIGSVEDIAPGATKDFQIQARLSPGPVPKDMSTPAAPAQDYDTVKVIVGSVWADPTPKPGQ